MNFIQDILAHFQRMNELEGLGTDYPIMITIYLGLFLLCFIANAFLVISDHGKRVVWLPDQSKVIKSKFNYMAMLACTFTGVYLVGSFPSELQHTYGTWNADFFYTFGQTTIMITAGIYSLATYKKKSSVILNSLSIVIGLSTSIPMAATTILLPLNIDSNIIKLVSILAVILSFLILASLSVKYDLLVKYSRINIFIFFITTVALFTSITTFSSKGVDTSKILPFQGMINVQPWEELLRNPYWWYFEATVVSWSVFCGRFVAYCSNGYSIKSIINLGTLSLIILTCVWHLVSAATGYTLSFSRGWLIYLLTALTMLAFAVTSLDSASKTLLNDVSRISKRRNHKERSNFFLKVIMAFIGTVNLVILYTGVPRLFTILLCLIFVPFLIRAIIYSIKFATGKVDFSKSGTITMEEYNKMLKESGKEPIENEFDKTSPFQGVSDQDIQ
jgi:choline-glycine betaine transporter